MITKVSSKDAPSGAHGEVALAKGELVGMRMWRDEPPADDKPSTTSDYETVGYVISGRAKLVLEDRTLLDEVALVVSDKVPPNTAAVSPLTKPE